MSPVETVLEFVRRINQRDADKLAELMTEDHVFIDSLARRAWPRKDARWPVYDIMRNQERATTMTEP